MWTFTDWVKHDVLFLLIFVCQFDSMMWNIYQFFNTDETLITDAHQWSILSDAHAPIKTPWLSFFDKFIFKVETFSHSITFVLCLWGFDS